MRDPFGNDILPWVIPNWRDAVESNGWGLTTGCHDQLLDLLPGESITDRTGVKWERIA